MEDKNWGMNLFLFCIIWYGHCGNWIKFVTFSNRAAFLLYMKLETNLCMYAIA